MFTIFSKIVRKQCLHAWDFFHVGEKAAKNPELNTSLNDLYCVDKSSWILFDFSFLSVKKRFINNFEKTDSWDFGPLKERILRRLEPNFFMADSYSTLEYLKLGNLQRFLNPIPHVFFLPTITHWGGLYNPDAISS